MDISYKWLNQYIDIAGREGLDPDSVAEILTSIGLETGSVTRVESIKGGLRGIVVGKVLTCEAHPDSDHLHITTVDLGDGQPTQIVCGAPNVAAGQTVVVATVGTTLYDGDKEFKIKKSKIRGTESSGMICAEDEIGVGSSHAGIIVLPEGAAVPGTPAAEYYGLSDDYVLEVDLTPNRIDAASHYGVARDLAAWLRTHRGGCDLHKPDVSSFEGNPATASEAVKIGRVDATGCVRYAGVTIRGIKVTESPDWLKERLTAIGQRPINNVVDITNYILHSFCQPLHCFDTAKISGREINVERCAEGTPFVTLDGVERKLSAADLMIKNDSAPMCIAGVFGGLDSGVTEECTEVFLESACFNPTSVRRTARRHGLSTDASFRFERGVDPNGVVYALKVAALLVKELCGGEIVGDIIDIYPEPVAPARVDFTYSGLDALAGYTFDHSEVDKILDALEINIAERKSADEVVLEVPTYRVDVTRPCDVIEDILRIYGYNNLPMNEIVHSTLAYQTPTDEADDMRRRIAEQLTGAGYREILNNSLTSEDYYQGFTELSPETCVRLLNPLSRDLCLMRRTLLFGGLESLAHNINRRSSDLAFYEFGNVYSYDPAKASTQEKPLAPYSESARLALWLTGHSRTGNWGRAEEEATFYDLRAAVDNVFARLGIAVSALDYRATSTELLSNALEITAKAGGRLVGHIGIVRPEVAHRCDVKVPVYYAELDWDVVTSLARKHTVTFTPLPKTQSVKRDLSLLIDKSVSMADVERTIAKAERRVLRSVELFDVYEGKNLPAGKKSYAVSMTFQDFEKPLQDKYVDRIMENVIRMLQTELGASLR